jgi:transcriptional regulator with XRE-family HTH domain
MRELADRVGITDQTLRKVERGDMTVGIGIVFEAATLVGVSLFHEDRDRLSLDVDRARAQAALLPRRVRPRSRAVKDDF